ncbi:MAG: GH36 C-terminal domain-containing protein, partial [Candidatus Poribacteria bacterium]|nr:GH36 C-terminal domain-containing protein [Candidatus Poribacteria bacterium]
RSDYQCGGIHEPENLFNPTGMQSQTYGLSLWGPLTSGCCREMSLYALRSAYSPGLRVTFEAVTAHFFADSSTSPSNGTFDTELAEKLMNEYKSLRHCFYGDFYPLTPYSLSEQNWMAWQFHRPDLGEGCVQAFRRSESDILSCQYRLGGLDPEARYSVVAAGDAETMTMTGTELTENGLVVSIPDRRSAAVITYKAELRKG